MSRFLLTCWSYTGHLFHGINIGRALRERGHECAFYSAPKTASLFADEGFTFFPFEKVNEEAMSDILFAPNRERSVTDTLKFTRTLQSYLLDTIPQQVEDLEPILAKWKPDVIVDDGTILGPFLVLWEKHNIPGGHAGLFLLSGSGAGCAAFRIGPAAAAQLVYPPTGADQWGWARIWSLPASGAGPMKSGSSHGLPPLTTSINEFSGTVPLHLVLNTPELDYNRHDLPPTVRYGGPCCLWNRPNYEQSADWLQQLPRDKPWVHATEGTAHVTAPIVLRAAAQGLANLPMEVILTGGKREPSELDLGPHRLAQHPRGAMGVACRLAALAGCHDHHRRRGQCEVRFGRRGASDHRSHGMGQAGDRPPGGRERRGPAPDAAALHAAAHAGDGGARAARRRRTSQNAQRIAGIFAKYGSSATAAKLLEELAVKHVPVHSAGSARLGRR